jgi:hypothetical protein
VGGLLALGAFVLLSAVASLASAAAWLALRDRQWDPERRARALLALRLLPAALSGLFVAGFVVPAYVRFEPREAAESLGPGLPLLAAAAAFLIGRAVLRLARAWRATDRLHAEWMHRAERIDVPGAAVPAYRIRHAFPVISVLGLFRPRLFDAGQVLDGLDPAELASVLRHEAAHVAARDNLIGLLMRSCPDWLSLTGVGAQLERAWAEASEAAADDHARRARPGSALDLAAALVKVARMAPVGARLVAAASALHDGSSVAERIKRLAAAPSRAPEPRPAAGVAPWLAAAVALIVAASSQSATVLQAVHRLSETIVHLLG